jgi:hypothetical protein
VRTAPTRTNVWVNGSQSTITGRSQPPFGAPVEPKVKRIFAVPSG